MLSPIRIPRIHVHERGERKTKELLFLQSPTFQIDEYVDSPNRYQFCFFLQNPITIWSFLVPQPNNFLFQKLHLLGLKGKYHWTPKSTHDPHFLLFDSQIF